MRRLLLSVSVLGAAAVACGLSITGTAPEAIATNDGGSSTSSSSGSSGTTSGSSTSSSGGAEAGPVGDAGFDAELDNDFVDAGGCVAKIFGPKGAAKHITSNPPQIDAQLGEWSCDQLARLDRNHAGAIDKDPQSFVDYAVSFDDTNVYFAFRVTGTHPPSGNDLDRPYFNDSVELYLGPDDRGDGTYVAQDLHLIVDYQNVARVYNSGLGIDEDAGAANVVTKASASGNDFIVEGSVPVSFFGNLVQAGKTLAFDIMLNDRLENGDRGILWNYQADPNNVHGGCPLDDEPPYQSACDTVLWGEIGLSN